MISRIWHGFTTSENAVAYEELLNSEIFPGIKNLMIPGFLNIHLLRRNSDEEVEFITIMWFENMDSVIQFAGADYEKAVVPEKARKFLKNFDDRSKHYEVKSIDTGL